MQTAKKVIDILKTDNVFLTGGGGVGKSYTCKKIIDYYKSNNKNVAILGSTGVSSAQIGGQTFHSFFSFGIETSIEEIIQRDKKYRSKLKKLLSILKQLDLLVIDEISMISPELIYMMKYRLESGQFHGKILIIGDFFQLPPVKKRKNKDNSILEDEGLYAFQSGAWEFYKFKIVELLSSKRTKNTEFFSLLASMRIGKLDDKEIKYLEKLRHNFHVLDHFPTMLFATNNDADNLNEKKLAQLPNKSHEYYANVQIYDVNLYETRIKSWINSLIVQEKLELKVGASVLFCVNKEGEYYNGERAKIISLDKDSIIVQKEDGSSVEVKRHNFALSDLKVNDNEVVEIELASFTQFPLKLAYGITIHKSQGMSINNLVCNIDNIFETSQLYVALSRAVDPDRLLLVFNGANFRAHLLKSIKVDEKVKEFYSSSEKISIP